jgi:hypothetical protein
MQVVRIGASRSENGSDRNMFLGAWFVYLVFFSKIIAQLTIDTFCSQLMSRLLHRALVTIRVLTCFQPLVDIWPLLALRPQLSHQNEIRRELHHNICRCDVVATQELSRRERKFRFQPRQIVLHVRRHALLGSFNSSLWGIYDVPSCVENTEAVESESCFCCVDPLADFVALDWVRRQESVGLVIGFTEVAMKI